MFRKLIINVVLCLFLANAMDPGYAQGEWLLSRPGTMVALSSFYRPPLLKGVMVDVHDPLKLDFLFNTGSDHKTEPAAVRDEALKLIRYFLAAFTIPDHDLWVNLSPYEKDRMIPDAFGVTAMGRDLLAQDYLLKQLTAALIYPDSDTGKVFWAEVYKRAKQEFGTTDIPTDMFDKVWIVPSMARVYGKNNTAIVVKATLKVMLDADYLATEQASGPATVQREDDAGRVARAVLRRVVIPVLEKEVNEGRHFAPLRQIYYSMILAKWYKQTLRQSILKRTYGDQNKIMGIRINDKYARERIYARYLEAFKKGAFNCIREEHDQLTQEIIPRKYFSGGIVFKDAVGVTADAAEIADDQEPFFTIKSSLLPVKSQSPRVNTSEQAQQSSPGDVGRGFFRLLRDTFRGIDGHYRLWPEIYRIDGIMADLHSVIPAGNAGRKIKKQVNKFLNMPGKFFVVADYTRGKNLLNYLAGTIRLGSPSLYFYSSGGAAGFSYINVWGRLNETDHLFKTYNNDAVITDDSRAMIVSILGDKGLLGPGAKVMVMPALDYSYSLDFRIDRNDNDPRNWKRFIIQARHYLSGTPFEKGSFFHLRSEADATIVRYVLKSGRDAYQNALEQGNISAKNMLVLGYPKPFGSSQSLMEEADAHGSPVINVGHLSKRRTWLVLSFINIFGGLPAGWFLGQTAAYQTDEQNSKYSSKGDVANDTGGIDLRPDKINLETEGTQRPQRFEVTENVQAVQLSEMNGLVPVIRGITSVSGLRAFAESVVLR